MPNTNSWGLLPYGPEDPEFEARVKSAVGSPYVGAVDKSRATRLPHSYAGLFGFYTSPNLTEERALAGDGRGLYRGLQRKGIPVEGDRVYAGYRDADTSLWAHEFRHRAAHGKPEALNRLRDAYYAGSEAQWDRAVSMWHDQGLQDGKEWSRDEALSDLLVRLRGEDMTFTSMPEYTEEFISGKANGRHSYGLRHMLRGLLDPVGADAQEKVNAPWKIWAEKRGLLE